METKSSDNNYLFSQEDTNFPQPKKKAYKNRIFHENFCETPVMSDVQTELLL